MADDASDHGRPLGFFLFAIALWLAMHAYAFERLVLAPALSEPFRTLGALVFVVGGLAVFPALARRLGPPWAGILHRWAFGWMGAIFLVDALLLIGDVVRWVGHVGTAREQALVTVVVGGGAIARAQWNASREAALRRVVVRPTGWPEALDGLTVVQLSDVHVSPDTPLSVVQELVTRVNALAPDLVVLTGDLVDGSVELLGAAMAPFAELRAPLGVFAVTGNHEYYSDADAWIAAFERLGMRVLQNAHVTIHARGAAFTLAGVPDWRGAAFGERHRPDLATALAGSEPGLPVVLLAHQPRQFPEAAERGVALQLSGHTHGGQLWPFTLIVGAVERPMAGLHRVGASQLYISRGTRYWGPAMRLGAPHELTLLVLERDR